MYNWLVEDLNSIDRSITPWVVLNMHCPFYNSNTAHQGEKQTALIAEYYEDLFFDHKVNVVLAGHVHAYERSYPSYNFEPNEDGVVYITIGDGGNAEGHASTYQTPQPSWSAYRNGDQYGYGKFTVHNETHLLWEWHENQNGIAVVSDSTWIVQA